MRPNRLTVKQADGHYHIYDHTVINETSCCDEYNRNAFSLYEGTAIDKLGQYEDLEEHDTTEQAYKSPIEAWRDITIRECDNAVLKAVAEVGIKVDKAELVKALEYDRQQFKKGYELGYKVAKDEMVRCKDCKHQRNWQSMCYCTIWKTVHGMGEDGFCGYGVRKEDV